MKIKVHPSPLHLIFNFRMGGLWAVGLLFLASCGQGHAGKESQLKAYTDSFATHYFNWQFQKAIPFSTPESGIWLRYAASNVHQGDIDRLRAKEEGASCYLDQVKFTGDSSAEVHLTVRNYLRMDSIGKTGSLVPKSHYRLFLVFQNQAWRVRMEGLPRNER